MLILRYVVWGGGMQLIASVFNNNTPMVLFSLHLNEWSSHNASIFNDLLGRQQLVMSVRRRIWLYITKRAKVGDVLHPLMSFYNDRNFRKQVF